MPPRDQQLPEGTDHIINGAMETGTGAGASTGSSAGSGIGGCGFGGTGAGGTTPGGSADLAGGSGTTGSGGFIGGSGDGTGGFASSGGGTAGGTTGGGLGGGGGGSGGGSSGSGGSSGGSSGGGSSGSGASQKMVDQVRSQVDNLKGQATDKVRQYADTGKDKATTALSDFAEVVNDAARSVDERLGTEYGAYAHRAADAVNSLVDGLRSRSVDDLLDDTRNVVRKSPGVAIASAALLGFAFMRVVKAGLPEKNENDVQFQPDQRLTGPDTDRNSGAIASGTGSQAPSVSSTTGV